MAEVEAVVGRFDELPRGNSMSQIDRGMPSHGGGAQPASGLLGTTLGRQTELVGGMAEALCSGYGISGAGVAASWPDPEPILPVMQKFTA